MDERPGAAPAELGCPHRRSRGNASAIRTALTDLAWCDARPDGESAASTPCPGLLSATNRPPRHSTHARPPSSTRSRPSNPTMAARWRTQRGVPRLHRRGRSTSAGLPEGASAVASPRQAQARARQCRFPCGRASRRRLHGTARLVRSGYQRGRGACWPRSGNHSRFFMIGVRRCQAAAPIHSDPAIPAHPWPRGCHSPCRNRGPMPTRPAG